MDPLGEVERLVLALVQRPADLLSRDPPHPFSTLSSPLFRR
jgi:hypothetical protein